MNRALLAAFACALAVVAGCSSNSGNNGVNGQAIAWAEQVCQTVQAGGQRLSQLPQVDPNNPLQARDSLVGYLGVLQEALDSVANGITSAGAPPVANGQSAVTAAMNTLTKTRTAIGDARTKVQQAPGDPAGFQQVLTEVGQGMGSLGNTEGPTKDLRANPELNEAFTKAPTCQKLDTAQK
jgi:hypothetical protein